MLNHLQMTAEIASASWRSELSETLGTNQQDELKSPSNPKIVPVANCRGELLHICPNTSDGLKVCRSAPLYRDG